MIGLELVGRKLLSVPTPGPIFEIEENVGEYVGIKAERSGQDCKTFRSEPEQKWPAGAGHQAMFNSASSLQISEGDQRELFLQPERYRLQPIRLSPDRRSWAHRRAAGNLRKRY